MTIPWWGLAPFVVMLLCIAILPLIKATEHAWEKNSTKLAVSALLGVPVIAWMWATRGYVPILDTVAEYLSFIGLLFGLFVVSGGIFLEGDIEATPANNTKFLALGGLIASFIGTTGAAMLLIRPLLNTNQERKHKVHTVVFSILVVANCGGILTPLGDPPLFLGYLAGVPFTWTFHLIFEWLFVLILLLITYYGYDRKMYAQEDIMDIAMDYEHKQPIKILGGLNFLWFAIIICAVAFNIPSLNVSGIEHAVDAGHFPSIVDCLPWRELVILAAAAASYLTTSKKIRFGHNEYSWTPIGEVAVLFIGIFATMIPALLFLEQVAPKLPLNSVTFFGFSGSLSAFLDNAPTYKTFFEMAIASEASNHTGLELLTLHDANSRVIPVVWLSAISLGSVFCGALTYIGNGPNFMTKSVAESRGVKMPSFGSYIGWSCRYLLPVLVAMVCIFITENTWAILFGVALSLALIVRAGWLARKWVHPQKITRARVELRQQQQEATPKQQLHTADS